MSYKTITIEVEYEIGEIVYYKSDTSDPTAYMIMGYVILPDEGLKYRLEGTSEVYDFQITRDKPII